MSQRGIDPSTNPARQGGISTLVVAVVLLIAATLITFFAAKVGVQETRMSANDYRHRQAFSNAETAADKARVALAAHAPNFATWAWTACAGTSFPCGDGTTARYDATWSFLDVTDIDPDALISATDADGDGTPDPLPGNPRAFLLTQPDTVTGVASRDAPLVMVGTASSDDGTALAFTQQGLVRSTFIKSEARIAPVIAPVVNTGGNLSVVTNPNAAGDGVPVSVWADGAEGPIDFHSTSTRSCQADQFIDNSGNRCIGLTIPDPVTGSLPSWGSCHCERTISGGPAGALWDESWEDKDLVDYGPFPDDLFEFLFGLPRASYATLKALATPLADCSSLGPASTGFFWVTGDCDISGSGFEVGSRASPVIVVVDGDLSLRGGAHLWGVLYVFDPAATVRVSGGFNMHGSFVSEADLDDVTGGTFNSIYDPDVALALTSASGLARWAPLPGGWNDDLPTAP